MRPISIVPVDLNIEISDIMIEHLFGELSLFGEPSSSFVLYLSPPPFSINRIKNGYIHYPTLPQMIDRIFGWQMQQNVRYVSGVYAPATLKSDINRIRKAVLI